MIMTVTMNASIDKLCIIDKLVPHSVMRIKKVINTAGGKGLNVARVARLAGENVLAVGLAGGYNGEYLKSLLKKSDVDQCFTSMDGETRTCLNFREETAGKNTEFLEPGPHVEPDTLDCFFDTYKKSVSENDVIVISGSVPNGVPVDYYGKLIRCAKEHGKRVILDTSGDLLCKNVESCPTMIKPNESEIAQLTGKESLSEDELAENAMRLHKNGIEIVAVSLGKEGVIVAAENEIYKGTTPDIKTVNTVGCGDSMVAGFAVGMSRDYSLAETIRLAVAISTSNALTEMTGFFRKSDLDDILPQINVYRIH